MATAHTPDVNLSPEQADRMRQSFVAGVSTEQFAKVADQLMRATLEMLVHATKDRSLYVPPEVTAGLPSVQADYVGVRLRDELMVTALNGAVTGLLITEPGGRMASMEQRMHRLQNFTQMAHSILEMATDGNVSRMAVSLGKAN